MQLQVSLVPNTAFTHNVQAKTLVAEISDLQLNKFDALYDDACDVGFAVRNSKTGNITRWALADEIRSNDADNEVMGWYFIPTPESLRRNPVMEGYCMTLIND
jgi:hypothetical protein